MSRASSDVTTPPTIASNAIVPARDRAAMAAASNRGGLTATVARWPLDLEGVLEDRWSGDAAIGIVRACLDDYRSGRADQATRLWHDDITWTVRGPAPVGGEWVGPDRVFAYHDLLGRLSDGTFIQRLIALEGSRGSIVDAYLRTTATRAGRRLDIPTLAVFELAGGRVQRVTELPGDHDAWDSFWHD
jgi:ketosteroid isomerase-like protein